MKSYLDLVETVLTRGSLTPQRATLNGNPLKMLVLPGMTVSHDLREGFPLLTTKKIPPNLVTAELDFFLKGEHRKEDLHRRLCTIWDEWHVGDDPNELGRIYGVQWRKWQAYTHIPIDHLDGDGPDRPEDGGGIYQRRVIDQLANLLKTLKTNPWDRRTVVSAWNPAELDQMALPPCHVLWQTIVTLDEDGRQVLNLCQTMRSADIMLGVPFNIASYAMLLLLLAKHTGMIPGILHVTLNNAHIYENHIEAAKLQLSRKPRPLPIVTIPDREDGAPFNILEWDYRQYILHGYAPHPAIRMDVAV